MLSVMSEENGCHDNIGYYECPYVDIFQFGSKW